MFLYLQSIAEHPWLSKEKTGVVAHTASSRSRKSIFTLPTKQLYFVRPMGLPWEDFKSIYTATKKYNDHAQFVNLLIDETTPDDLRAKIGRSADRKHR
jgi:hypothetical protein